VEPVSKEVKYYAPETMEEALQILKEHGSGVSVLAGGTDLVRDMNLEFKIPDAIMWIGRLGLEYIESGKDFIRIGAATRMQTAAASELVREKAWALAYAAGKIASPPVRTLATVGGNLCNASPGADTGCALLGLDALVVLKSVSGAREVALREFFLGPNETVLQPGELMTEIRVRPAGKGERSSYLKIGRRKAMTLAVINTTSRVKVDGEGKCEAAYIAVGAAAPTPLRIEKAEKTLVGQPFTEAAILEAASIASEEIKPIDDVHGTKWYRRKMARVLVEQTLREAGGLNGGVK
jgi:CO/xanthine dehydrogenase FAD-binding subunit